MSGELERGAERTRTREVSPRLADEHIAGAGGRLASSLGNHSFGQLVARLREGEGVLAGGVIHPDVEAAIVASRGRGHRLHTPLVRRLEGEFGESFADVRVHADEHAVALARAVAARAFTVGSDIYFARGEYKPTTPGGAELITHELAHVVQQRAAAQSGPLIVSQPGDALEREAETVARELN